MRFVLDFTIANTEGALERVLGRLRQRSFTLCNMQAGRSADHSSIKARIIVEGTRSIEQMVKHLSKLCDVHTVTLSQMEATIAHVYSSQKDAQEPVATYARASL